MPEKKSIKQELIDAGFDTNYNSRLKTISPAAQGLADVASILNLNTNLEQQRLYQESLVEKRSSGIADIIEKSYLIDNKDSLLSDPNNRNIAVPKPSFSQIMADDLFSTSPKGNKISLDKISLDPTTKQSFTSVANVLNKKLNEGDMSALEELKGYYQKAFNSGFLSDEAKAKLQEEYFEVSKYFKDKSHYNIGNKNLQDLLDNTDTKQKQEFLKKISDKNLNESPGNFIFDIGLNLQTQGNKDNLLRNLLDLDSYVPGSFVYNTENLNSVKNSSALRSGPLARKAMEEDWKNVSNPIQFNPFGISFGDIQVSQKEYDKNIADIEYNYSSLMGVASKNKEVELSNKIEDINEELKTKPNDPELLNQKNKFQSDLSFVKELTNKIKPLQDKKNFYKSFYPELYKEEVKKEKSEIAYNDLTLASWSEHPLRKIYGNTKNIGYRTLEQTISNAKNKTSGIKALFQDYSSSLGYNLAAKAYAPPSYRRVNDLNKNSLVEPNEVVKDANGEPIYVSNIVWTDEKGKSHWNLSAATEQTLPIAVDVAETILLSRGVGAIGRGTNLLTGGYGATWANIGKVARLSTEAQKTFLTSVAPRISTFGNVFTTTFPRFYAEERNNFKDETDALKVSALRAGVEALTETIVPETEFFKGGRSYGALDGVFKKLGKYDPTDFSKFTMKRDVLLGLTPANSISALKAGLLAAPYSIRKTLSGALQETFEEELSLLGNYFVDKYAASKDFTIEQTNDLTFENGLETFIGGFIPSLFISGSQNAFNVKTRRDQARWDIANNPEQYFSLINKNLADGKITKDEAFKRTAAVTNLKNRLDGMTDISNIKNISNLLDDRELQYSYFNAKEQIEELLSIDTSTFTEEQLTAYQKELDDASNVVIDARKRVEQYVNLTEEDKKKIIAGTFEKQSKQATDPNSTLSSLLNTLFSTELFTKGNKNLNFEGVSEEDPRQDFISQLYDKFLLDVEATIDDRLAGFQTLLEETPEKLTTLELQLAKDQFIPFLQRYKDSKRNDRVNVPFAVQEQGPQPKTFFQEDLVDLIKLELATRTIPTEEEYREQAEANFKNPETKHIQNVLLVASELSQEELESGQLAENAHSHLTDGQRLILGDLLEKHQLAKEENPNQKSELEKIRENADPYYRGMTRGLSEEDALAKKKEVNKSIVDAVFGNVQEQEQQIEQELKDQAEGKKPEEKKEEVKPEEKKEEDSKYERGFTPESSKEPKEEVEGTRKVDEDIFNQFRESRIEANNQIEDAVAGEETQEDKQIERAKQNNQLFSSFSQYTLDPENYGNSLSNLESAMLGFFLEESKQKKITKFFDTVEKNNPDFTLLKGVIDEDYMEEFQLAVNAMLSNNTVEQQTKVEEQEENGDTIPQTKKSESETQDNNVNEKSTSETNTKENEQQTQPEVGNFIELNIVELKNDNTPSEDPAVIRNLNIVQIIDNEVRKNSGLQVYSLIQTPLDSFKKILSPENYAILQQLVSKKSLTQEQKNQLKEIFTYNGMPILDERFVNYVSNNPSSLASSNTSLSVVVDQDNNPIYFNSDGQIGTSETGVPLVNSLKSTKGIGKSVSENISAGPVRARFIRTSDTTKTLPLGSVKSSSSTIYVHLDATTTRVSPFGNVYTLETGGTYLQNNEAVYPYNRVDVQQIEGKNLYNLIQAFNEGTLPEEFPKDATEFLALIGNNFYSNRKNENLRFFPQGNFYVAKLRDKNQLSIKTQNDQGKAVIVAKSTQEKIANESKVRKAVWTNLLKTNTPFDAIVFDNEGKPSIKKFNSYSDYILSPEFGATVTKGWQKTLRFEAPLPIPSTTTEVQPSVAAVEENTVDELAKSAPVSDIEFKEDDIEKRRQEDLNALTDKEKESIERSTKGTPISKDNPGATKVGDKFNDRLNVIVQDVQTADNFDPNIAENEGEGYTIIERILEYGEMKDGKLSKAPVLRLRVFNNKADADADLEQRKQKLDSQIGKSKQYDKINAKYDAEYVDAVKKGTITKEQAMKALEEVGRKDSSAYAELAALEQPVQKNTSVSDIEAEKADAQTVKNRMQEIEKQPISINVTTDASGKMEKTSEEVVSQIKAELDKIGLPYTDVVANDKGSTYFVVTKDAQQHEILRLLKIGGALVKPVLIKAKWINHLIKTQPEDLYNFVNAELAASEQPVTDTISNIEAKKADIDRTRQEKYNAQDKAMNLGQVLDNQGDPVYGEDQGIAANGLSTLTDKEYGHGHNRTSGLKSLEVLESLLDGSVFSGMFGKIKKTANETEPYTTWESSNFVIASNNSYPITDDKLNLNEIEVILNAGLSPFAQELANKYPNVIFKDFNGKKYDAELAALEQSTQTAQPKEAPKKKRRSALERLNSQIINEQDPEGPDFKGLKRARTLSNKITKEQNEAAKAWVNNHPIFKNTSFIFNETVKNPAAYAVWSKAGIQLFEGANYAEAYHEAWHEFSQLYLTSEQKNKLYAEAKKIWGDIPFVELEEKIAEAFRAYALTGGQTLPQEISNYKETKSIFQSIWDFLTNLFSEKKTIDKYFGQLYKGNISQYTRKESNQYFKELFSSKLVVTDLEGNIRPLSFVESQKVIDEVDGLFVTVANEVLKPHNASVINVLLNPDYVKTVYAQVVKYYKSVYQEEYEILLENDENGIEDLQQEELLNYLGETIQNLPNILQYHKNNSSLFDNKVKKSNIEDTLNSILENSENEGIGSFEQSIEENSQQDLASDVIINAIRTLPRYQNGEVITHPTLGFSLLGDFNENWTILQRTLSGSNTYEDMYSKLKELSKKFPQFKTLLTYLKAPNESITRITDLSFKSQFFNLFTMPYIDGSTVKITRNDKGEITETRVLKALSLDAVQLRSQLDNDFNFEPGQFKNISNNGSYSLDTEAFFTTFPEVPSIPAADPQALRNWYDQIFLQLDALGVSYSSLGIEALRQEKPETLVRNLNLIRTKLASLVKTGDLLFTPLTSISKEHTLDGKEIKSENTAVAYFLGIEIEANPSYANDMRYNAVGKQIWSVNQHTYMTKIVSILNDANLYPTLDDVVKEMPHLDYELNTNARGSWVLQYLFNTAGKRISENGQLRKIDIVNLLGIEDGFDGEKTIDSINAVKHFADVTGLLNGGVEEINRLSGKSTTRGIGLDLSARQYLGLANTENSSLPFLKEGQAYLPYKEVFSRFILPILKSEIDTFNNKINDQVFKVKMGETPSLTYFQDIIQSEALRLRLVNDLKDIPLDKLSDAFVALPYSPDIYSAFNEYINTSANLSQTLLQGYPLSFEQLVKYHTYSFIMRVEQHKLFFNHPFYYKNAKDIEKRLSAWNAYGSYPLLDDANINALYNLPNVVNEQEKAYQEYALQNNIPFIATKKDPKQVSYLVFNDNSVFSETANSSKAYDSVRDAYVGNKDSKTQDAASVATLDFFRKFYSTSTGITVEMEQEFERQNKIWSTYLKLKNATSLEASVLQKQLEELLNEKPAHKFNIKKLQYAGNNPSIFGPTIPVFHKYSVKPLLPSEAVLNPRVADIMEKLYASGADYGVFESGTKISETISPVDLFDKEGKVDKSAQVTGNIDFNYLKEQVIVENKESFLTIFSSQLRKLIYKDITNVNEQELYDAYALYMKNLVEYDSELFLEKLDNKEKLVEFILGELSRKGAAQATKDLIQIKEDGKLKYLLDSLVDRTVMESAIVSSVKNKVIRQKVNGAQRVQFPVSLMSDRKLKYYDLKDGKVTKAETIISFSKLYYPLLNLEYQGRPIGELNDKGEPINPYTALKRLNEALNDSEFRDKHQRQITISAIRIPGQGYNSMENFEIVEFLPEESGDIILVPDEMVVKSGSDFDIDKLFCYDPYIEKDGSTQTSNLTPKEAIARKKQLTVDYDTKKAELQEHIQEKTKVLAQLDEFLASKNIDSVSDIYKELKALKAEVADNDPEFNEEVDLNQMLLDKFKNGLSREEILDKNLKGKSKAKFDERKDKIKQLGSILSDYSSTKLGFYLSEANEAINETRAELEEIKNEIKSIRGRMSNNILFNISDRLTQEEIFEDLITPNSTSEIDKAADPMVKNKSKWATASYTNIVNPIYQLYVFSLNSYKKSLGTDAKNNVLHSILQKAKIHIIDPQSNKKYVLPANRNADGNLTFEGTRDTNGQKISLVQGQMISAHVDIEKDDRIALLNFNNVVTPIVNYMTMLGTPFQNIVDLINNRAAGNKESAIARYSKNPDFDSMYKYFQKSNNAQVQTILKLSLNQKGDFSKKKFINNSIGYLVGNKTQEEIENILDEQSDYGDIIRFSLFMELKEQADNVRELSANTDFDTFSPQNFESLRRSGNELAELKKKKFFDEEGFEKVLNQSIVSSFQVQSTILDKFEEIFPVSANKTVTDGIVLGFGQLAKKNRFLNYESFSRTFKNDFLFSMYINEVPNVISYETLLDKTNPNNLKAQYESLKKRFAEKNIDSNNRVFNLVRFNTDENSKYFRTGLRQNTFDYSVDYYREEFENGLNYSHPDLDPVADAQLIDDFKSFMQGFAYAGILGSQLNKRFDSYLPIIPEQIYTYPMNSILENFQALSKEQQKAKLSAFYERFKANHPEFLRLKDVNPDLRYYKDYVLSRASITPTTPTGQSVTNIENLPNEEEGNINDAVQAQSTTQSIVKGEEVKAGIFVNEGAISKEEQLELFNYLKPFLEEQAAKTNKGKYASKMIGLGLRWDYKSNNPERTAIFIPDVIKPTSKLKYGYYTESINGQPLGQISDRFREIIAKATGLDMSMYDGAIINLYDNDSFISSHNDVDESRSAINYPVVGINLGGSGNFSIESRDGSPMQLNLDAGTAYVFGVNGVNREVFHRTFPTAQNTFLPELTTKLDNKTYPAGSYRVTITMRRVMPLESNMPVSPLQTTKPFTQPTQLNLFEDQPRLTSEEISERERVERESAIQFQRQSMSTEELYYEYTVDKEAFANLELPAEAEALYEMKPTRDSFVSFADKANLQGKQGKGIVLNYIAKKGEGFTVDIISERASDIANREITPGDIIDFILRYPGGIGTSNSKSTNSYYGSYNPDFNPKYDNIRDLIKERKNQRIQLPTTPSLTNVEDDIFGPLGDINDINFDAQNNQAAQDSFMGLRNRNKKGKEVECKPEIPKK